MAGPLELLREVMSLTNTVSALRADVDRIIQKVEEDRERIIKLEAREELLKKEMANEAMVGVQNMTLGLLSRIASIEQAVGIQGKTEPTKALE